MKDFLKYFILGFYSALLVYFLSDLYEYLSRR